MRPEPVVEPDGLVEWDEVADQEARERRQLHRERVERVLEGRDYPRIVFQPVADLRSGAFAGFEALSRFSVGRPDEWFALAAEVGLSVDLELKAIRRALGSLAELPGEEPYLSINASPVTLRSPELRELLIATDLHRVVVEVPQNLDLHGDAWASRALARLRDRGARLAVDDAGSSAQSLQLLSRLEPDLIKLNRTLTRSLSSDALERSLVGAMVQLSQEIGASVVAVGVEGPQDLLVARELGVQAGQGYHISSPQAVSALGRSFLIPAPRR